MNVAIIGASRDRRKFGNKAVRAYDTRGFDVYPVNLSEAKIEGHRVFRSVRDVPVDLDVILVYLPPDKTLAVLDDIAAKGSRELYINPGAEDAAVVARAKSLGLDPILACSIIAIGESPGSYR